MSDFIAIRPFEQGRFEGLIDLARALFDREITYPEARVLMHSATARDLPEPSEAESRPNVRSEFLRWLMTDPEAAKFIDPKGIRIWSVTIPNLLDLQGATIPHLVHLLWSNVESEVVLVSAELKGLLVFGGNLRKGLLADGITVRGPLFIKGSKCSGTIRLTGADIGRNLDMSGTELLGRDLENDAGARWGQDSGQRVHAPRLPIIRRSPNAQRPSGRGFGVCWSRHHCTG